MIIAVSGKGGTGKTLVSALLVKFLSETNKDVLAIDADPDSNLPETLGIKVQNTVGNIREQLKKDIAAGKIPDSVDKWSILEYRILESVIETKDFDILVMGRSEGSGCYCAVNTILRKIIKDISSTYDFVIIDTEAGLEHLSRRTTQDVDLMIIVTDQSKKGVYTVQRIIELSKELEIKFKDICVILNRVKKEDIKELKKSIEKLGVKLIGTIPEDPSITEYDMKGIPLTKLPKNSPAIKSMRKITNTILNEVKYHGQNPRTH